jgi:DNA polymerase elongation subunit (family B)
MPFLYLDIETVPAQSDEAKARIAANVKPPAQMKKAETIAAWEKDQKADAVAEAISKTGLNGAYGHICCIGFALNDEPATSISWPMNTKTEAYALAGFYSVVSEALGNRFPMIIGHNVANFDIRFIIQRSIALGIRIPGWFPLNTKPWGSEVFDTMTAWAGVKDTISLDNLCAALGLPGKGDIDGSMVGQMFADGRHAEIAEYCRADVERTRAVHRKMQIAFGEAA